MDRKDELIEVILDELRSEDIIIDEKTDDEILDFLESDPAFREKAVGSIIYKLKPEDIVIDEEKEKYVLAEIEKLEQYSETKYH